MAVTNAFEEVFSGENPTIDITVFDADDVVVDISSATEITWKLAVDEDTAPVISKSKTGGEITFTGGGTDGVFRITTLVADFVLTAGTYYQESIVTMPNNTVHVTTGTLWLRSTIP